MIALLQSELEIVYWVFAGILIALLAGFVLVLIKWRAAASVLSKLQADLSHANSQKRELEESKTLLHEKEKELEEKNQVIERQRRLELVAETAGQAAHDIQNLIVPVLANVHKLEETAAQSSTVEQAALSIRRQMDQLLELNTEMLTLARRGRIHLSPIKFSQLVSEVVMQTGDKRVEIGEMEEAWMRGSWTQVARAVTNVVVNAIEALPQDSGRVLIRCGKIDNSRLRSCFLGFLQPGEHAFVEVKDTGRGISRELFERIFEPFFSGKGDSNSGLGLSVVAAVVDDHRGAIDVSSKTTEGTVFTLFFPAAAVSADDTKSAVELEDKRVLILTSEEELAERFVSMLEESGYDTTRVRSLPDAIEVLQTEQIDLMLLGEDSLRFGDISPAYAAVNLRPGVRVVLVRSTSSTKAQNPVVQPGVSVVLESCACQAEVLAVVRQLLE